MAIKNTIFALATPPGKSGVAILRLSGPDALSALVRLSGRRQWESHRAALTNLLHPETQAVIDRGLAIYFAAPKSFTGEEVVELHCHGSLSVIRELLEALALIDGLRPAEPGEFTRRAFGSGKMDLIEAEGLADLIDAQTPKQREQALRQMGGALSDYYTQLRLQIIECLAHLEAYIDFPDEEIPEHVLSSLTDKIHAIGATIDSALGDHASGEKLRSGIRVVILGAPNAGKSSLLNYLAGREAAIVSHRAGTTRDVIEVHLNIAGYPVILTDTAGLRTTDDEIEEEGVRRARSQAQQADIKLALFDATAMEDSETLALLDERSLKIYTKGDLYKPLNNNDIIISTHTGQGCDALLSMLEMMISERFALSQTAVITRSRHRALLSEALYHLKRFNSEAPLELSCEELRLSAQAVGKITGKIAVDELLDVIFKQFCIGK